MEIKTNNQPRDFVCFADLPLNARADFDYIGEDEHFDDRFVQYRRQWLDLHEFSRIVPRAGLVGMAHGVEEGSPLLDWDGIQTDSYFSAHVARYVNDNSQVIIGRCYC